MNVTIKGTETAEQLRLAAAIGADRGQRYYFASPLKADGVAERIGASRTVLGRLGTQGIRRYTPVHDISRYPRIDRDATSSMQDLGAITSPWLPVSSHSSPS